MQKPKSLERDNFYPNDVGVVYVISDQAGHVKVGVSTVRGLPSRLVDLQIGNALKLVVRYHLECHPKKAFAIEARAQRLLSEWRTYGEWFRISVEQATIAILKAEKQEEDYQIRLIELAKLNDAINEKRIREAEELRDDDDQPEQSLFDMMLGEGNFAPETRRKRSIFDD